MDKFCVDCKHYTFKPFYIGDTPNCKRNAQYNLVNGNAIKSTLLNCYSEREDALRLEHFRCGKDAKYYEPEDVE